MKNLIFIYLLTLSLAALAGSSGVGNTPLNADVDAHVPDGFAEVKDNKVYDSKTKEALLEIKPAPTASLKSVTNMWPAKLGMLQGLEQRPKLNEKGENSWVVCGKDQKKCWEFKPLSTTNPKVQEIMGSLAYPNDIAPSK